MALPPELIDEILAYLQVNKRMLQDCSLVAKSWVYPNQKLLHMNAHLTPETYRIWQENVSPAGTEPLQHFRILSWHYFYPLQSSYGDYFG